MFLSSPQRSLCITKRRGREKRRRETASFTLSIVHHALINFQFVFNILLMRYQSLRRWECVLIDSYVYIPIGGEARWPQNVPTCTKINGKQLTPLQDNILNLICTTIRYFRKLNSICMMVAHCVCINTFCVYFSRETLLEWCLNKPNGHFSWLTKLQWM